MIKTLCKRIESEEGDLSANFVLAAQVFENHRGATPDESWERSMRQANFSDSEIEQLRRVIVQFIEKAESRHVASAIWALGKRVDEADTEFFRRQLLRFLDGDAVALYQCMIALSNQGHDVFQGAEGSSMFDEEANRASAKKFLGIR